MFGKLVKRLQAAVLGCVMIGVTALATAVAIVGTVLSWGSLRKPMAKLAELPARFTADCFAYAAGPHSQGRFGFGLTQRFLAKTGTDIALPLFKMARL